MKTSWRDHPLLLRTLPQIFIMLFALSMTVSIAATQICLSILFLLVVLTFRGHRLSDAGVITIPLILYSGFSMISAVFSLNLQHSLSDIKSLLLFAIPFIIAYFKGNMLRLRYLILAIYIGAVASALYALYQYWTSDGERSTGFMSHYMTFAEQMMLVGGIAFAMLLYEKGTLRWISASVLPVVLAGCAASLTRSSWIAFLVGVIVLLAVRKPILTVLVPPILAMILLLAPGEYRQRVFSIFNPSMKSNHDRVLMIKSGLKMVHDYPLFGVGPDVVGLVYPQYKEPEATPGAVHLHNNIIQIAAERGLPALAAWLYLMAAAAVASFRLIRRLPQVAGYPAAALFCVVGLFVSGFFEYNFEDSEIKMLFLFILTLMFLAREGYGTENR